MLKPTGPEISLHPEDVALVDEAIRIRVERALRGDRIRAVAAERPPRPPAEDEARFLREYLRQLEGGD